MKIYFPKIKAHILSHKRRYLFLTFLLVILLAYTFSLPRKIFDKPTSTVIDDREGRLLGAKIADDGYPQQNFTVVLPRQLDGSPGQAVFRAAHRRRGAVIFWHVGDRFIGSTEAPHQIPIAPVKGTHRLTLVDEK